MSLNYDNSYNENEIILHNKWQHIAFVIMMSYSLETHDKGAVFSIIKLSWKVTMQIAK